jgi:hypothetical protein
MLRSLPLEQQARRASRLFASAGLVFLTLTALEYWLAGEFDVASLAVCAIVWVGAALSLELGRRLG